ncbi:MAG: hypothetical protein LBH01_02150 [Verrucomicrobiales bacterium]|nr:hypothetical protein [Verrucomicrobiales bacterium]
MNKDTLASVANRMIASGQARTYNEAMAILGQHGSARRRRVREMAAKLENNAVRAKAYRERHHYLYD